MNKTKGCLIANFATVPAEEAIRRETERRADEIVRKMAENKPDLPDGKTEQAVR
ncbi:TPA: hypothetical protein N6U49_005189, partial [Escherichia coli]|nr:hypothetical protein [Escherichia coli]